MASGASRERRVVRGKGGDGVDEEDAAKPCDICRPPTNVCRPGTKRALEVLGSAFGRADVDAVAQSASASTVLRRRCLPLEVPCE